jgi:hypothetical protein
VPGLHEVHAQLVDGGRLADAGNARDAEPQGGTFCGQQRLQQGLGLRLVLVLGALHQSDGAGQRGAFSGANAVGHLVDRLAICGRRQRHAVSLIGGREFARNGA